MEKIRKAVIPAAGLGTRFLPATKAQPKEMLPVLDTPVIQLVVQEAINSGIDDIVIITGRGKRAVEDHFDYSPELVHHLESKGQMKLVEQLNELIQSADIHYIRQSEQKGLGHAIYCARKHIGGEPFAVLLGDEVIDAPVPCTKQLMNVYEKRHKTVIGVLEVPHQRIKLYGCVAGSKMGDGTILVSDLVEKPEPDKAPSDIAIDGRYLITPKIFDCIEKTQPGAGGEIQLTDALRALCKIEPVYATTIEGTRYDIGTKLDYAKAFVSFALKRPELREEFTDYLKKTIAGK
jgi:UTP--glucose-1-phosphate uridylyltransferase